MSTLLPRAPYTDEEVARLYPKTLKLQLVQVRLRKSRGPFKADYEFLAQLLRHGERTPVTARFQNAGLAPYWPYCNAATWMANVRLPGPDRSSWNNFHWHRRLEAFGDNGETVLASGPSGEYDALCQPGEMTDKGYETTLALGQRLRHLYVDQLNYMPEIISGADIMYLRTTAIPRALVSLQQCFLGMYPASARTASFSPPTIISRTAADETLYPNPPNCRRLSQLSKAFAQRTADRWNETEEMDYVNSLISKWMPEGGKRVAVDSHPRLSGIMDTINSTLAHGRQTRLPSTFYDSRGREIMDKITMEEWFSGYQESREFRELGIGSLIGDIVARMVNKSGRTLNEGPLKVKRKVKDTEIGGGGEENIKFAMSGCHDSTLAAVLSSLGAFEGEKWPPYTSHLAIELFREEIDSDQPTQGKVTQQEPALDGAAYLQSPNLHRSSSQMDKKPLDGIARTNIDDITSAERQNLNGFYVRVRYNDRPIVIPGCKLPGNHLKGNESFCTLDAFKSITEKFTPRNWKEACVSNLDKPPVPSRTEPAGY